MPIISKDRLQITINLRKNVFFHDGTKACRAAAPIAVRDRISWAGFGSTRAQRWKTLHATQQSERREVGYISYISFSDHLI